MRLGKLELYAIGADRWSLVRRYYTLTLSLLDGRTSLWLGDQQLAEANDIEGLRPAAAKALLGLAKQSERQAQRYRKLAEKLNGKP